MFYYFSENGQLDWAHSYAPGYFHYSVFEIFPFPFITPEAVDMEHSDSFHPSQCSVFLNCIFYSDTSKRGYSSSFSVTPYLCLTSFCFKRQERYQIIKGQEPPGNNLPASFKYFHVDSSFPGNLISCTP